MKKGYIFILVFLLLLSAVVLASCNIDLNSFTTRPNNNNDYNRDAETDENIQELIQEGDIVKVYKDYIVVLYPKALYIVYSDAGTLTLHTEKRLDSPEQAEDISLKDMLIYKDMLIVFTYQTGKSVPINDKFSKINYMSRALFFDLGGLTSEQPFAFEHFYDILIEGYMHEAKIQGGTLVLTATSYTDRAYEEYLPCQIEENHANPALEDNAYSPKVLFVHYDTLYNDNIALIAAKSLEDLSSDLKCAAFYGNLLYADVYEEAIFPLFREYEQITENEQVYGVYSNHILKLSKEDLSVTKSLKTPCEYIVSRFCMQYTGDYLYLVSYNGHTRMTALRIFDADFNPVGELTDIAAGERLVACRFAEDYAYIVTFLQIDPVFKINISDKSAPVLEAELELPGYVRYMEVLDETRAFGIGTSEDGYTAVNLYDIDTLTLLDSCETELLFLDTLTNWEMVYIDYPRSLVILTGIRTYRVYKEETGEETEEDTNNEENYTIEITISTYIISYADDKVEILTRFDSEEEYGLILRTFIKNGVLYVITEKGLFSYDADNGFAPIDSLLLDVEEDEDGETEEE